jgi:hypothetical protein
MHTTGEKIARAGALGGAFLGLLGILAWPLEIPVLARGLAASRAIAPSAACALLLLGLSLLCVIPKRPTGGARLRLALTVGFVALYGLLDFVGFLVGRDLNGEEAWTYSLGRQWSLPLLPMSPMAALFMVLMGGAMLFLLYQPEAPEESRGTRFGDVAGALGTTTMAAALVFLLGYAYGAPLLYRSSALPIAFTSALGFFLLAISVVATAHRHRHGRLDGLVAVQRGEAAAVVLQPPEHGHLRGQQVAGAARRLKLGHGVILK